MRKKFVQPSLDRMRYQGESMSFWQNQLHLLDMLSQSTGFRRLCQIYLLLWGLPLIQHKLWHRASIYTFVLVFTQLPPSFLILVSFQPFR
jgi:hypothetical protein